MADNSDLIRSLLVERAGYLRVGKPDRVAQVDEQLALHGYEPEPVVVEASATVEPPAARGRRTAKG